MLRRGGKRKHVVQLGNSGSKLHRYGYSKQLHSGEVPKLVGDYPDTDSEPEEEDQATGEEQNGASMPDGSGASSVPMPETTKNEGAETGEGPGGDTMDDELRNFLSEIEAIPMPTDTGDPPARDSPSVDREQAVPETNNDNAKIQEAEDEEDEEQEPEKPPSNVPQSTKKPKQYSMFVKGGTEFVNSPSQQSLPDEEVEAGNKTTDLDLPEEPVTPWQMVQDEATQYYYYWNYITNEVTWEIPTEYTQYLLLHKEYSDRLAKLTPEQLKALEAKNARLSATTGSDSNSQGQALPADQKSGSSTHKRNPDPGKAEEQPSRHRHEKKKKKKRHKRKHSDEDSSDDERSGHSRHSEKQRVEIGPSPKPAEVIGPSPKPEEKVSSPKPVEMGPSPKPSSPPPPVAATGGLLSIVSYASDQDEDDDDSDAEVQERLKAEPLVGQETAVPSKETAAEGHEKEHKSAENGGSELKMPDLSAPVTPQLSPHTMPELSPACAQATEGANDPTETPSLPGIEYMDTSSEDLPIPSLRSEEDQGNVDGEPMALKEEDPLCALKTETEVKREEVPLEMEVTDQGVNIKAEITETESVQKEEVKQEQEIESFKKEVNKQEQSGTEQAQVDALKPDSEKKKKLKKKKKKVELDMFAEDFPILKPEELKAEEKEPTMTMPSLSASEETKQEISVLGSKEASSPKPFEEGTYLVIEGTHADGGVKDDDKAEVDTPELDSNGKPVHPSKVQNGSDVRTGNQSIPKMDNGHSDTDKPISTTAKSINSTSKSISGLNSLASYGTDDEEVGEVVEKTLAKPKKKKKEKKKSKLIDEKKKNVDIALDVIVHGADVPISSSSVSDPIIATNNPDPPVKASEMSTGPDPVKETESTKPEKKSGAKAVKKSATKAVKNTVKDSLATTAVQSASPKVVSVPSVEDTSVDIDPEDLDDIDRALERALEKDRALERALEKQLEQKMVELKSYSKGDDTSKDSSPTVSAVADLQNVQNTESTDSEALRNEVKDKAELALNKLEFLDISTDNLSRLLVLFIELQTRMSDWSAGGLSTEYFLKQLQVAEGLLEQYETSAVPQGWACQWDRAMNRYYYRNLATSRIQWEYPETETGKPSEKGKEKSSPPEPEVDRSRDVSEDEKKSRSSSSRHRKREDKDKDRSKYDKRGSSRRHRRKRHRRREPSSSSDASEEETASRHSSSSRHHHKSKKKKRKRTERSPSVEVIGREEAEVVEIPEEDEDSPVVEESSAQPNNSQDHKEASGESTPTRESPAKSADNDNADIDGVEMTGDADIDGEEMREEEGEEGGEKMETGAREDEENVDGEALVEEEGEREEEEVEEEVNSAVISKPPQIIKPPEIAAIQPPQLYAAPAVLSMPTVLSSGPTVSSATVAASAEAKQESTAQELEGDKSGKKKKKDKKSSSSTSTLMKKKHMSSMVQKWQRVKKEVEKEDRVKEARQAAIRQKISELK